MYKIKSFNPIDLVRISLRPVLTLFLSLLAAVPVLAEKNYVVAGSAYNIVDNQLAYRELYTALDENKSVTVDYVSPEGNTFATKTLVYQGEPFQPAFELEDKRDNEYVSAQFQGARLILSNGKNSNINEKVIFDNARLVVDAGFDAYIQLHWDQLMAGKRLKFDFALPLRLTTIQLEVRKIKATESPVRDKEFGSDWVHFRIAPARAFISFFSDPIFLAYNPQGKYLMRYYGRSNLDNDAGEPVDVRIEYEYLD
ncbi:hypothetical protein [Cellvibrio sp. PSBB023]|uniref:hypothetical protein n=1 Tax=Cellvibrio sp. PSBB023 TaxID=1945512 RepID=UPI00098FBA4D|nr:hypothetical protein [Cellvibrio sp. PSBB023]AQT59484.1 hypothetical protein B0D95_04825 [Cellvibrio sp. PSBB023]